jgi:hypothetical protein
VKKVAATIAASFIAVVTGTAVLILLQLALTSGGSARLPTQISTELSGWELIFYEVAFYCVVLMGAAGSLALSVWLSRRFGGSTPMTIACTLFLLGLMAWPFFIVASHWNCGVVEGFPLPMDCD